MWAAQVALASQRRHHTRRRTRERARARAAAGMAPLYEATAQQLGWKIDAALLADLK